MTVVRSCCATGRSLSWMLEGFAEDAESGAQKPKQVQIGQYSPFTIESFNFHAGQNSDIVPYKVFTTREAWVIKEFRFQDSQIQYVCHYASYITRFLLPSYTIKTNLLTRQLFPSQTSFHFSSLLISPLPIGLGGVISVFDNQILGIVIEPAAQVRVQDLLSPIRIPLLRI